MKAIKCHKAYVNGWQISPGKKWNEARVYVYVCVLCVCVPECTTECMCVSFTSNDAEFNWHVDAMNMRLRGSLAVIATHIVSHALIGCGVDLAHIVNRYASVKIRQWPRAAAYRSPVSTLPANAIHSVTKKDIKLYFCQQKKLAVYTKTGWENLGGTEPAPPPPFGRLTDAVTHGTPDNNGTVLWRHHRHVN